MPALLQRIGELERDLEGLRGEAQKYCAEQESIRNQLAEKAKVSVRRGRARRVPRAAEAWGEWWRGTRRQRVQMC